MSLLEQREFLQTQIQETNRLLELAGDHPLMAPALRQRIDMLRHQLATLQGDYENLAREKDAAVSQEQLVAAKAERDALIRERDALAQQLAAAKAEHEKEVAALQTPV